MVSTRNKIENTLQEIYGCISDDHREEVVQTALLKMAYKEDNDSNILSSVMDAIDEIEILDNTPISPSCIRLEASSDIISWDDIEQYLQEDHIDDFETRLAEVERDRDDLENSRVHKKSKDGYYREPNELQGKENISSLDSEYKDDDNREYDPSAKTYTSTSVDPSNPRKPRDLVLGLDNRKLNEGNPQDAALDVWPPRTRADVRQP